MRWTKTLAVVAVAFLGGCATVAFDPPDDERYAGGRFLNVGNAWQPTASRTDWRRHSRDMLLGRFPDAGKLPPDHVLSPEAARAGLLRAEGAELAVTWIGHATTLIRLGNRWILTDPALMDTVGAGPIRLERLAPPRPALADLPPIDVIVISHADHDHLDVATLRRLARRNPEVQVFVPLGTGALVRNAGFRVVHEMDWYETVHDGSLTIQAVPAIHGVRRPPHRLDSMLWAGWILEADGNRVYFAGDTGFGSIFEEIRRISGPVDVALVPIGAWSPRWFQAPFHVDPDEAADIARIVGARTAIGIHWGTFPVSEEAPTEQKARFIAAGHGIDARVPRIGETIILRE